MGQIFRKFRAICEVNSEQMQNAREKIPSKCRENFQENTEFILEHIAK